MKRRGIATLILTLAMALALSGCGGSAMPSDAASPAFAEERAAADADYGGYWATNSAAGAEPMAPMEEAEAPAGGETKQAEFPEGVKMIFRAGLDLETTEFEQAEEGVRALTRELGGYFEQQSTYSRPGSYRSAEYTIRVPAARFEDFLERIGTVCTVTHQTRNAENVSERYYDMESRLETAKIKLDRLQDLLSRAEEMEDIITLESAISETEYQIEQLSGELRHYDALIDYSTITVQLNEVYRVTETDAAPMTFSERVGSAFRDGLRDFGDMMEDLIEWFAYHWLRLLFYIAVIVGAVRLVRRLRARKGVSGERKPRRGLFGKKKDDGAPAGPEPGATDKKE